MAQIYVGTYAKYNGGSIAGKWIDFADFDTYEEFTDFCKELHKDESDPEYMVQDFECFPKSWYSESGLPDEETFDKIKEFIELDEDEQYLYTQFLEEFDSDATMENFRESYSGTYESQADYAESFCEECGYIPKDMPTWLTNNIDWQGVADEFIYDVTYLTTQDGKTAVFNRNY